MALLSTQFHDIYGLDSTMQGLIFLTIAAGTILSALTNSVLLDRTYRRHALKMGLDPDRKQQISMRGFPIERVRIEIGLPFFVVGSFAVIVYGWMLDYQVHIAGPIVMLVIIGYTTLAGFNTPSVLLIDLYRPRAAAASAAANLVRCLLGRGHDGGGGSNDRCHGSGMVLHIHGARAISYPASLVGVHEVWCEMERTASRKRGR